MLDAKMSVSKLLSKTISLISYQYFLSNVSPIMLLIRKYLYSSSVLLTADDDTDDDDK